MTPSRTQSIGAVLLITIDNPPINATGSLPSDRPGAPRCGPLLAVHDVHWRGQGIAAVVVEQL